MSKKPDLSALFGAIDTSSFLGLEKCENLELLNASLALIGIPCATPYQSVGPYCKNAPQALRASIASLSANINRHNFDLNGRIFPKDHPRAVDCGDLSYDEENFQSNRDNIFESIKTILSKKSIPIVIGGDDSIPIPVLQAFEGQKKYTILQIDAHIDWRKSHMDETLGLSSTMRRASEMKHIERIVQVGSRGLGSAHSDDLADALEWGVNLFTAYEVHSNGIADILETIPEHSNIIISLDVDALDPSIVPGVIGRTPGGLTYFQTLDLIKGASKKGRICGINFVEYMPEVDIDGIGALTTSRLIAASMGIISRQEFNQTYNLDDT
ncbi:MAG: arginase family protein [Paracoccaceae bacterium]|nr:arginase family protein [Paracoccaceae bacterium]